MCARYQIATLLVLILVFGRVGATAQYAASTEFEQELLSVVNEMRAKAGVPALRVDPRLKQSALKHLAEFAAREGILSDQYPGEPNLLERIAAAKVSCTTGGEVLLKLPDTMNDEPHRIAEALQTKQSLSVILNPRYTAVGFGVAHTDFYIYAVGNLTDSFRLTPIDDAERSAKKRLDKSLKAKNLPPIQVTFKKKLRQLACEAAKADSLEVGIDTTTAEESFVYTTADPEHADLLDAITNRQARSAIRNTEIYLGACFAASKSFPEGRYWFVVWLVNPHG
jgi:uncharacterized protein YkwD